jgi:hypothetical protein
MKKNISILTCLFAIILLFGVHFEIQAKTIQKSHTYYIDSNNGNDSQDGLSQQQAWKTIQKVNAMLFKPGDKILFKSGCRWTGQLHPQGSGAEKRPICIDKYGKGALPIISQENLSGTVITLQNQDQWEIRNLEIDGGSDKSAEVVGGIRIEATTAGRVLHHFVVSGCVIRHILGTVKSYESCAIWVGVPGWDNKNGLTTGFDDVLIENNRIYRSDRTAILVWTTAGPGAVSQFQKGLIPSRHVIIRNNLMEDIGGDAILVLGSDRPLIEHNIVRRCCIESGKPAYGTDYNQSAAAIWLHHCEKGVMQYNAVYDCLKIGTNNDGMAYDFDYNCNACILQYNYSNNNAGGFLLIMPTATNNIARYNISENDCRHVLYCVGDTAENNQVYNNTFYINRDSSYIVSNAKFINNIFMTGKDAKMKLEDSTRGIFKSNCYYGNWSDLPADGRAIMANPLLKDPGHGGMYAENLKGYALKKQSPCIRKGTSISNCGAHDAVGKHLRQGEVPDIGAIRH